MCVNHINALSTNVSGQMAPGQNRATTTPTEWQKGDIALVHALERVSLLLGRCLGGHEPARAQRAAKA